jgi:hypothetical protein
VCLKALSLTSKLKQHVRRFFNLSSLFERISATAPPCACTSSVIETQRSFSLLTAIGHFLRNRGHASQDRGLSSRSLAPLQRLVHWQGIGSGRSSNFFSFASAYQGQALEVCCRDREEGWRSCSKDTTLINVYSRNAKRRARGRCMRSLRTRHAPPVSHHLQIRDADVHFPMQEPTAKRTDYNPPISTLPFGLPYSYLLPAYVRPSQPRANPRLGVQTTVDPRNSWPSSWLIQAHTRPTTNNTVPARSKRSWE